MREEHRSEIIHDALNMLDDELIEEVEKLRGQIAVEKCEADATESVLEVKDLTVKKQKFGWKKWTALAASICVLITCGWIMENFIPSENKDDGMDLESVQENLASGGVINSNEDVADDAIGYEIVEEAESSFHSLLSLQQLLAKADDVAGKDVPEIPLRDIVSGENCELSPETLESGVEIPAMEVKLKNESDIAMDMVGFFIHEGRCYVQNEYFRTGAAFVGEYAGSSSGLIDEWTEKDGYVNGAGSVAGKFYEVRGVDPEFMLCMVWENGVVETYVNNNGITLWNGSDVVEKRLHLINNYKEVSFFTDKEWNTQYETKAQPKVVAEENDAVFDEFLEVFGNARFMYIKDSALAKNLVYNSDAIYHLYFTTKEGVTVQFWLLGDGYVVFQGLNNVCVQIDTEVYDAVIEVLKTK